jgi:small-conductance mechanosensitive channel
MAGDSFWSRMSDRFRQLPAEHPGLQTLETKIRPDFTRAVAAGVLALACLIVGVDIGGVKRHGHLGWVAIALTIAFVAFGAMCIRSAGREITRVARHRAGIPAASALRTIFLIVGLIIIGLGLLQLLDVDLRTLLLGGAITGVIVGIAAQQSLGNFFAGLVLLFTRPYVPGNYVKIRSGSLGGPFEGTITYAGLMYTIIDTAEGRVNLPNAGLLAAAIGPVPEPPLEPDPDSHL